MVVAKGVKRVAMLVWNDFLNDARVLKEAETLQSAGYEVTVYALIKPGVTEPVHVLSSGIRVVRVSKSIFAAGKEVVAKSVEFDRMGRFKQGLKVLSRVVAHLKFLGKMSFGRYDVIHAHDVNVLPTAWLAAVLSRAKIVYDAHEISTSREGYNSFRRVVGCIEKALMPRVHGSITTTDVRAKFFARAYGVERPLVLQNRPRFHEVDRSDRLRVELQLEHDWPIVIYQGGLQQGRGLDKLVEASKLVKNAYFVFIGGGRLQVPLRQQVEQLGLSDRVYFIDTVALAELPSYTASADIGVQPIENTCLNHYSTDSNKLFEFVMAGLPVIASDLPEINKIVTTHKLGLLVKDGKVDELSEAIQSLVDDADLRCAYQASSCAAAAQLSWEAQESELSKLYEGVLSS